MTKDTYGAPPVGEVPASVKVERIMEMVRETRAEMEAAGEIVYRWMALDYSGYCYGSNPPDNLPARCNLKAFYAAENHPDDRGAPPVGALTEFEHWLNDRRMLNVSEVFHDVVAKFADAMAAPAEPSEYQLGYQQGRYDEQMAMGPPEEVFERGWNESPAPSEAVKGVSTAEPEGWKLVPTTATRAMQDAWDSAPFSDDIDVDFRRAYQLMLAAAPSAVAVQAEPADEVQCVCGIVWGHTTRYGWEIVDMPSKPAAPATAEDEPRPASPVCEVMVGGIAQWGKAAVFKRWLPGKEALPDGNHLLYALRSGASAQHADGGASDA